MQAHPHARTQTRLLYSCGCVGAMASAAVVLAVMCGSCGHPVNTDHHHSSTAALPPTRTATAIETPPPPAIPPPSHAAAPSHTPPRSPACRGTWVVRQQVGTVGFVMCAQVGRPPPSHLPPPTPPITAPKASLLTPRMLARTSPLLCP